MADDVEVKLGANTGDLTGGMSDAASQVADSLNKMADALNNFTAQHKSKGQDVERTNASMGRSFVLLKETIQGNFEGAVGVIERFKGTLASLTTIIAGGFLWSEVINHLKEFNGEVTTLENVLGVGSEKATELALSLKIAGSSAEAFTGIALRMGRQLKNGGDELVRLGVSVRDASGNFLPLNTIMQNAFDTMQTYKAGTDQAEFALSVFGRSVSDVYTLMAKLPAAQERAKQLMQDMNVEFGPDRQQAVRNYEIEVGAFKEMLGLTADDIGIKVLPKLEALAKYFNEVGPSAANFFVKSIVGMLVTGDTLVNGFQEWGVKISEWWDIVVNTASYGMRAFSAAVGGGWAEALAIWNEGENKRIAITLKANAEILGMEADLQKRLAVLGGDNTPGKPGPGPLKSGSKSFVPKPQAGSGDEAASWETLLKEAENGYNNLKLAQGSFEVWSVQMTRDYWAEVLAMDGLTFKERQAASNHFYDAERQVQQQAFAAEIAGLEAQKANYKYNSDERIAIAQKEYALIAQRWGAESAQAIEAQKKITEEYQKAADQRLAISQIEMKSAEATANFEYQQAKTLAAQQLALRQISVQQELALEQQYLDEKLAKDKAAVQAQIDAMGPNDSPVKMAQLKNQLLALEQQYQQQKTQIANQAELDRKQYAIQAANDVEAAFANTFSQLATSGQKWTDTLKAGVKSLADQLNQLFSQAIFKQLLGAGTQGGDFLNKIFGSAFGVGGGGKAADTSADAAHTAATTTDTTAITANATGLTTLATTYTTTDAALTTFAATIASTQAALASFQAQLAAGGGGGGLGSLLGGGGGGDSGSLFDLTGGLGGIPGFAVGTPFVPQDMIARVHKGEAIVPAKYNNFGGNNTSVSQRNNFTYLLSGPVDMRTQQQINRRTIQAIRSTAKGGFA